MGLIIGHLSSLVVLCAVFLKASTGYIVDYTRVMYGCRDWIGA